MVSPSFYIFHICFIVSFCKLIVKKSFVGVIWKDKKRYKHKLVPKKLPTGIGPVTSALPMRRSTAWATAACRITQRIIIYYNAKWLSTVKINYFLQFFRGFQIHRHAVCIAEITECDIGIALFLFLWSGGVGSCLTVCADGNRTRDLFLQALRQTLQKQTQKILIILSRKELL